MLPAYASSMHSIQGVACPRRYPDGTPDQRPEGGLARCQQAHSTRYFPPRRGWLRLFQDHRGAVRLPMRGQAQERPRVSRLSRLPASAVPLPDRDSRPRPGPSGRESAPIVPCPPAGARLKRVLPPIPYRAADGRVRPSNRTLPHGSPGLPALRAHGMAARRHAAGGTRTASGRVALCGLQLAVPDRAGRPVRGAMSELPRNEPGTAVRRLVHVLELRRGLARSVSRRASALRGSGPVRARFRRRR